MEKCFWSLWNLLFFLLVDKFSSSTSMKHETSREMENKKKIMTFLISFFCNWNFFIIACADSFFFHSQNLFSFIFFSNIFSFASYFSSIKISPFPAKGIERIHVGVSWDVCDGILCCSLLQSALSFSISFSAHLQISSDFQKKEEKISCFLCIQVT